eukprot:TRINITY_DN810_c0_g1_i1.p1 TRINITY_DN810_c0_g1~~TRINITY_DN810_c0_g1_i1.p1  ORF type:complete len:181 (-),score=25.72 TRINITY_DN810_c0_g1_i1:130-672(-)
MEEVPDYAEDTFCRECGGVVRSDPFFLAFGICTCYECRQHDPYFQLVPKSRATAEYLLTAGCFRQLKYLERPNPHHQTYQPMKLYLRGQLEHEAIKAHGALNNIELVRKRRHEEALARKEETMLKRMKKTMTQAAVARQVERRPARHQHSFPPEREVFDPENENWTQSCECGFTIPFEKF